MKYLRLLLASFIFGVMVAGPAVTVVSPTPVNAACGDRVLGLPPWYRGLTKSEGGNACMVMSPTEVGGIGNFITRLALNIIEMGLVIVGYIALFFILYGGFQFITGGDTPGQVEKARHSVLNAVIGLVISLSAVAIVNIIFSIIG